MAAQPGGDAAAGAGPRALLLQLAHPSVAAGVADHSDFRADPWRRLDGDPSELPDHRLRDDRSGQCRDPPAERAPSRRSSGRATSARDPELSLWVHATLVDSTIAVYDAWLEPLSRDRRAAFYAETRPIGRAFGVPETMLPADIDAFDA